MTSSELQQQVQTALGNLSVPVTRDYSEFESVYPHIVYREISNVPALHGDNREICFRSVYQVAIVSDVDNCTELEPAVEEAMINLGFMRSDTQDIFDGNFNRVLRFSITALKN